MLNSRCDEVELRVVLCIWNHSIWFTRQFIGQEGEWVQCSACVTGKSSDPKINWLENNVSCIYWFMFFPTCDQKAHILSLRFVHSWFLTHIVSRTVSAIGLRSMGRCGSVVAFNLVSGQSTLVFIYFGFLLIIMLLLHAGWLECVSRFYAKSIFNLAAEHLCKYQILTTNTGHGLSMANLLSITNLDLRI